MGPPCGTKSSPPVVDLDMDNLADVSTRDDQRQPGRAGALAAALALGVSELAAAALRQPSPVKAVGDWVIAHVPPGVKDWAIATFGRADKQVLIVGIVVVVMALGMVSGRLSRRREWLLPAVFGGFALAGLAAAFTDRTASALGPWMVAIAGAASGVAAHRWMMRRAGDPAGRREFLRRLGAVSGLALLAAVGGRLLAAAATRVAASRHEVVLPAPAAALPPLPAAASLEVPALTPIVVPNGEFYRIDTALAIPRVDLAEWRLRISGLVENEFSLSYSDLLSMPMVESYVTLCCVSNPVGGDLVGNARWLGVPLGDLLRRAGVAPEAGQIVGVAVDGFTAGFPVGALAEREALVAVGMNGEPLPLEHGFPARLVVAGLYGYVSATKWLAEVRLTDWEGFDGYWIPRGWAKEGPIRTQSRIDVPRRPVAPGPVTIAGVAWAPGKGIERVEVQVGDRDWIPADLSESLSANAWVQWRVTVPLEAGSYPVRVRATDGSGELQDEQQRPPAPSGATGWHQITVTVQG
jgi:DMSO/TMAO reductase YedYZ molybdopterin-dependent catalytic subunit